MKRSLRKNTNKGGGLLIQGGDYTAVRQEMPGHNLDVSSVHLAEGSG